MERCGESGTVEVSLTLKVDQALALRVPLLLQEAGDTLGSDANRTLARAGGHKLSTRHVNPSLRSRSYKERCSASPSHSTTS